MLTEKCRIAVLVSGGGTNLQAIMDACDRGIIKSGEVVFVASNNEDAFALKRASSKNIEAYVFDCEKDLIAALKERKIELVVLAGFLKILSPEFINEFRNRIINVHPALIPSFSGKGCYGLHVHEKALAYGVKVTGATVHFVNEVPDGGKIIAQKAVSVNEDDTPESLQKRVMQEAEWIILPESIEKVSSEIIKGEI